MKILLINPWGGEVFPPPSIGYLQSAIKDKLPKEQVVSRDLPQALELLNREEFDLVGVTFHSFSVRYARQIRDKVKRGRLICGGHHPSSSLGYQLTNIGYEVIKGEGENEIIKIISGSNDTSYKTIDEYPFPDYTGLTGPWNVSNNTEWGYPIISSRGCPFSCNFCASSAFWNRKWFYRSPENVIAELEFRIKGNQMKSWMFEDDNFTLMRDRTISICDKIITELIPKYGMMNWQCASRAETLNDKELCMKLKQAGCHTVWLGIESLSQDSLDRCKKSTTVEKMLSGIEMAENNGLTCMAQFIVGLIGDTYDNILETSANIRKSRIHRFGCNTAWVLPDTEIYNKAKEKGFNDDVYLTDGAPFYTSEQLIDTLNKWRDIINNSKR